LAIAPVPAGDEKIASSVPAVKNMPKVVHICSAIATRSHIAQAFSDFARVAIAMISGLSRRSARAACSSPGAHSPVRHALTDTLHRQVMKIAIGGMG